MFRYRWLNIVIASFIITNILLLVGKNNWFDLIQSRLYHFDLLVTFISVYIIFQYVDLINTYLDGRYTWTHSLKRRFIFQILLAVIVPGLLAIVITYIQWEYIYNQDLIEDLYFNNEYLPQILFIVVVNMYLIISYLYKVSSSQTAIGTEEKATVLAKKGTNKILIATDQISYIVLRNGVVFLHTFSGENFILSENMDHYEGVLSNNSFFRANRQFIINRSACKSFNAVPNGKVEVLLMSSVIEVIVSQKRAANFRSWIQN